MQTSSSPTLPLISWLGMALALAGVPVVITAFAAIVPDTGYTDSFVYIKELSIFAACGLLLLLVVKGEKLGLDSIGLHPHNWPQSLKWALITFLVCVAVAVLLIMGLQIAHIPFGNSDEAAKYANVSPWAFTFMCLRAGIVEEVCYRGYLMERLNKVSNHPAVYFWLPAALFGLWHFRQGLGGIIVSFVLGAVLAWFYWKRRDLKSNIIAHFMVDFVPNVLLPMLG